MKAVRIALLFWLLCFACAPELQKEFGQPRNYEPYSITLISDVTNPLTAFVF